MNRMKLLNVGGAKNSPPALKLLIAVPVVEWRDRFVMSFMKFIADMNQAYPGQAFWTHAYREPPAVAMIKMVEQLLGGDYTHILWIEDDHYDFSVEDFKKLYEADKDVISGCYFAGRFPHHFICKRKFDPNTKLTELRKDPWMQKLYIPPKLEGVVEVDLIGDGFTLVKTDVLRKMSKPWYEYTRDYYHDAYFCQKLNDELGIKPFIHCDVWINHREITRDNVQLYEKIGVANGKLEAMKDPVTRFENHKEFVNYKMKEIRKIQEAERTRNIENEVVIDESGNSFTQKSKEKDWVKV